MLHEHTEAALEQEIALCKLGSIIVIFNICLADLKPHSAHCLEVPSSYFCQLWLAEVLFAEICLLLTVCDLTVGAIDRANSLQNCYPEIQCVCSRAENSAITIG